MLGYDNLVQRDANSRDTIDSDIGVLAMCELKESETDESSDHAPTPASTTNDDVVVEPAPVTKKNRKKRKKLDVDTIINGDKDKADGLTSPVSRMANTQASALLSKVQVEKEKLAFQREKIVKHARLSLTSWRVSSANRRGMKP